MSGLSTNYHTEIQGDNRFFKSITLFTSRYDNKRNYIALYPNNIDIETNKTFANTILESLGARVETYSDYSVPIDWSNPRPRPQYTRQISVPGNRVRTAAQRLLEREEVGVSERTIMAEPLRELDRCLDFISRLSSDITVAQQDIIKSFVNPYLQVLRDNMEPWQIRESSKQACVVVKGCPDSSFKFMMRTMWINQLPLQRTSDTNPNVPVINKDWEKDKQNEILDSLYVIGKILSGKANLEGALIQSGEALPNLQIQEQVVMGLIEGVQ
jgi:hypothetical protein